MMASECSGLVGDIRCAKTRSTVVTSLKSASNFLSQQGLTSLVHGSSDCVAVLDSVIDRISPSFTGLLTRKECEEILLACFVNGPLADSLLCLNRALSHLGSLDEYKLEKFTWILDHLFKTRLATLFIALNDPQLASKLYACTQDIGHRTSVRCTCKLKLSR